MCEVFSPFPSPVSLTHSHSLHSALPTCIPLGLSFPSLLPSLSLPTLNPPSHRPSFPHFLSLPPSPSLPVPPLLSPFSPSLALALASSPRSPLLTMFQREGLHVGHVRCLVCQRYNYTLKFVSNKLLIYKRYKVTEIEKFERNAQIWRRDEEVEGGRGGVQGEEETMSLMTILRPSGMMSKKDCDP
eukprot:768420-Hanusia_phi.AAC.2